METPPEPLKGYLAKVLNKRFDWIIQRLVIAGDSSIDIVRSEGREPSHIFANGGSGGTTAQPLTISPYDETHVYVSPSTVANGLPQGMTPGGMLFSVPIGAEVEIYAAVQFNVTDNAIAGVVSRSLVAGLMPDDDQTTALFHVLVGTVDNGGSMKCTNSLYGPIDMVAFRDWKAVPARFGVQYSGVVA